MLSWLPELGFLPAVAVMVVGALVVYLWPHRRREWDSIREHEERCRCTGPRSLPGGRQR